MYLPHISDFNSSQQDDTGSRQGSRGDSAVSEFTTDSGVVLYTGEVPTLPRAVPWKLPPLVCVCVCVKECPFKIHMGSSQVRWTVVCEGFHVLSMANIEHFSEDSLCRPVSLSPST